MSCRRYAMKRDANEGPIVATLRAHGWFVLALNGAGLPDLLCVKKGRFVFLEVKAPKGGRATPAQVELHASLQAAGLTVAIVTTPEEALAAVDGQVVRTALDVRAEKRRGLPVVEADARGPLALVREPGRGERRAPRPKSTADVKALATPATYRKGVK